MNSFDTLARRSILGRIFAGLFATLLFAAAGTAVGQYVPPGLFMPLMLAELVMVFAASMIRRRRAVGWAFVGAFTFLSGVTLTPILAYYTQLLGVRTVQEAFLVTAGAFGASAFVASRRSVDFSWLGHFAFAGIIVLIGLGLVNLFVPFSSAFDFGYTYLGIAVFVGYMLFDVNRITRYGVAPDQVPLVVLSLYLDFVNLFLFVLRLLGLNVRARN